MRMTFAVAPTPPSLKVVNEIMPPNILVAFPYAKALDMLAYKPEYVITDSGAFSAWNIGKQIDIQAYADWALSQQAKFPRVVSVNLDVIPGEKGRTSTKQERFDGMKQSLKNADFLRAQGLNVMEVFHQDEPKEFLFDLIDRLQEDAVLGISPRNDVHSGAKLAWQQVVLSAILSKRSIADFPRTHGLAVTSVKLLRNFPYYSGDSSTWLSAYRYGNFTDEFGKIVKIDTKMSKSPSSKESIETLNCFTDLSVRNLMRVGDAMTNLWAARGINWRN